MHVDCMLDLETLGTGPDAVVLSMGAVLFNRYGEDNYDTILNDDTRIFNVVLEVESQLKAGRSVTFDTIAWWMEQNILAKRAAFAKKGRKPVTRALTEFYDFAGNAVYLWGNGSSFDNVITESLYRDFNVTMPFEFYNYRDLRTAAELSKNSNPGIERGIEHDALQDAAYQVLCLQRYCRGGQ